MPVDTDHRSPDEIERDIRQTQADMSRTVEQIEGEFSGRNMLDALFDKADQNGIDARYLLDAARRNPLALGMIAAGGLWLVSDADARPSALAPERRRSGEGDTGHDHWHPEHRSYAEHMARCERQPDEDDLSYRRRRDDRRASYFMIEQSPDEDESSFRQRLDAATDRLRERREKAGESARHLADRSRERSRQALAGARDRYAENPLLGGLAAAFVGAVAGAALPASRAEKAYAGELGEKAIDGAAAKARDAGEAAHRRKDALVDRAEEAIDHAGKGSGKGAGQQHGGQADEQRPPRFAPEE